MFPEYAALPARVRYPDLHRATGAERERATDDLTVALREKDERAVVNETLA